METHDQNTFTDVLRLRLTNSNPVCPEVYNTNNMTYKFNIINSNLLI